VSKSDFFGSGQVLDYLSGATYMPDEQLAEFTLGATGSGCFGGIKGEFSYNQRLQPQHMVYTRDGTGQASIAELGANSCSSSTGEFFHRMYQFGEMINGEVDPTHNNGNVGAIKNCLDDSRSQSFAYDNENRLIYAWQDGADGFSDQYTYDAWGNLTDIWPYAGAPRAKSEWLQTTANAKNQLAGLSYDNAGNVINDGVHRYQYDQENRVATVDGGSATYTYDGDGQRVIKSLWGGDGTIYWYGAGGEILAESDLGGYLKSEYVYFNGKRLARTDNPTDAATAQLRYYIGDHLGSTSMVMDETFTAVEEDTDYYPFGAIANSDGLGDLNHFMFTGKERDTETGNDYFGARYFASNMGRFMTPDWEDGEPEPIPYALWEDPQTLNLYAYVENNPTSKADPNGHCVEDLCVGEAIAVTAAVAAVSSFIASPTGQQIISNGVNALMNTPNVVAGLFRGQAAPGVARDRILLRQESGQSTPQTRQKMEGRMRAPNAAME
jgi:RHS repeat-associated protein